MPARSDLHTILIIGSGPIVIGQACEFDYSGCQAVQALKEDGYRVILLNPNPATMMTTPSIADAVYCDPIQSTYIEEIIKRERPQGLLATMGGQTALNAALQLESEGILERYSVELLGAKAETIRIAEDRGAFRTLIEQIGLESPHSYFVRSLEEGQVAARQIGLPLIIRPSFTLGGSGGHTVSQHSEIDSAISRALRASPDHSALIEEALLGWAEIEFEVMRDRNNNAVIICAIENIDAMGIHTGDSITVAPTQTLSDQEYQTMRNAAIAILRAVGVDCGGSNVQFAWHPQRQELRVIEMNPRVSRSSALASKATGFPIARCAARLAVGYSLDEVLNEITGSTYSCFEPTLDYCAVKVPRFELHKFAGASEQLGTAMKSIGESLALGRTFIEALNKAICAAEYGYSGLERLAIEDQALYQMLRDFHPLRIFAAYTLLYRHPEQLEQLATLSGYSHWLLSQLAEYAVLVKDIERQPSKGVILPKKLLMEAKRAAITDSSLAQLTGQSLPEIQERRQQQGIHATFHSVDTCAGEFAVTTPYYYSTYGEQSEGEPLGAESVIIIGSGPNRIGQGLEFDTCCTLCSLAFRQRGIKTIMVNSNPETVSTDFNISDRLYLEPLTLEHLLEIMKREGSRQVVAQLGGQTALNMAAALAESGAQIIGTPVKNILMAEDRAIFSKAVRECGLHLPPHASVTNDQQALQEAQRIGYPVLVRPSFVLGGVRMAILYSSDELEDYLSQDSLSKANPLQIDAFLEDAFEYDLDAIADGESLYIAGLIEHIEAAGIHSGDSAGVFPPYKFKQEVMEKMRESARILARTFGVIGFMNVQYAVKDNRIYIIEINPRVSRTVPFLSKVSGVNLVDAVVAIWNGQSLKEQGLVNAQGVGEGRCQVGWAIKEAQFSFERFQDFDPLLGPEMRSTGESIGIGSNFGIAYAKASAATGANLPTSGRLFVSVHHKDRHTIFPVIKELSEAGFELCATEGTATFLRAQGLEVGLARKAHEKSPNIMDEMAAGRIQFIINTPLGPFSQEDDSLLRIGAIRYRIPYTTTTSAAEAVSAGIRELQQGLRAVQPLPTAGFSIALSKREKDGN